MSCSDSLDEGILIDFRELWRVFINFSISKQGSWEVGSGKELFLGLAQGRGQ